MRQIKFRGKSRIDGEWFYGNYTDKDTKGNTHICNLDRGCLVIDPETVGEFSGLYDKDGKEIYEGDIIACGTRRYVCEFVEGGFEFRDLSDGELVMKAIVIHSYIVGNKHEIEELRL